MFIPTNVADYSQFLLVHEVIRYSPQMKSDLYTRAVFSELKNLINIKLSVSRAFETNHNACIV